MGRHSGNVSSSVLRYAHPDKLSLQKHIAPDFVLKCSIPTRKSMHLSKGSFSKKTI